MRLASVDFLDSEGHEIEFAIKRVLSVTEPSKVSHTQGPDTAQRAGFASAFPEAGEFQKLKADLEGQKEDIRRIDSNGFRIVSALDKRACRIEGVVTKLKGTVDGSHSAIRELRQELVSVKADIGAVRESAPTPAVIAELENRLASVSSTLADVRQQLTTLTSQFQKEIRELKTDLVRQQQEMEDIRLESRDNVTAGQHAEDMASLRSELVLLRRQMEDVCSTRAGPVERAFPSRELEVLTSNIAKIGSRASQVETLQMELEILKGRVERAETSRPPTDNHQHGRVPDPGGLPTYSEFLAGMRKRAASPGLDPVPKRPASSVGYPHSVDGRYTTLPTWLADSPPTTYSEHAPGGENAMANSAKRGRKPLRNSTIGPIGGISSRLRRR